MSETPSEAATKQDLLRWAETIAGIARTGLGFTEVLYERERYEEILKVAADIKQHAEGMDTTEYVNQLEEDFDNKSEVDEQEGNPELLVSEVEDFLRNQTGQT